MRKTYYLLSFLLIWMVSSQLVSAQETVILQDNLLGTTLGTTVGGTLTAEGYKPGLGFNHILYDVPSQVVNGYIQFEMKGFSDALMQDPDGGADADNGFFGMYDGRGSSEPIQYFNNFKYNYFRWNFHWRQNIDRLKAVIDCADPVPENLNSTQAWHACGADETCADKREWYSEPTGNFYNFNAATWYTVKCEWNNKNFKVTIDGTTVWETSGPNDYAPIDFKIWLGSAPGYVDKYGNWVQDLIYRNFKVVSYGVPQNSAPTITSTAVTSGNVGQLYSYDVNASGNPASTYSLTTFPSGMTINSSNGLIQWTPGSTGNYNVTVKAANGVSPDATQSFTINVQPQTNTAPVITSAAVTYGAVAQLYSYDVNASGTPASTFSLTTFPTGMIINSTTGLVEWMPSSTGNINVTVKAANGINPDATQSFSIIVRDIQISDCPPSIISYWKLDEVSGTTYEDFIGTNNATTVNAPTPLTGQVNGAQQFNGINNRITAPANVAYDWSANSSFTFEAWIKHPTSALESKELILGRKSLTNQLSIWFGFDLSPNITFSVRSKTGENFIVAGPDLFDDSWHHVVAVKDGNLNQLRLYVDGVLQNTIAASYTSGFDSPTANMSIGWRDIAGDDRFFNGLIDEVAIYNSALDAGYITQHYSFGLQNQGYCEQAIAPSITSTAITSGMVGQPYSYDVEADGNPAPHYTLSTFPTGMTINSTSGLIQWTPILTGNYNVTVTASNGVFPDAAQSFSITVEPDTGGTCSPFLISYWKLDETNGSTYSDFAGISNAASSNVPTPVAGRVNGAQQFNGTSNLITVPANTAYDWLTNSSFTFETWINHPVGSFVAEEVIVSRKATNSGLSIRLGFNSTSAIFAVRSTSNQNSSVTGTTNLYDGNWHHVVGVKDGSSNQLIIYVDGVLENTASTSYTAGFESATAQIGIGWKGVVGDESYFNGLIDEVAIHNNALDAASILSHYNKGLQDKAYCEVLASVTAPVISSTAVTSGTIGQPYIYDVDATGNPTPSYLLTAFPTGMTINSTSGLIQWTPPTAGSYNVTVRASNGVAPDAIQSFVIIVQQPAGSTCPPSIISYWKLDETSGSSYNDFVGNIDGDAPSLFAPTPVAGRVNGAQQFDGTSDRITIPANIAFDWNANSNFTFEAWIKHPVGSFVAEEVIIGRKPASGFLSIKLAFSSTSVGFSVRSVTNESKTVTGTGNLYDGNWHHVVGVKDGPQNRLRIYVDGVKENTIATSYTSGFASPTTDLTIGWRNITGEESFFNGVIDEVAIYNSALDSAAIVTHYNGGLINLGYCDVPLAPTISSTPVTSVRIGQLYSYDVNATGNPTPKYVLTTFPVGMTIDSTTGLIQWTPSAIGDTSVTVQAVNGVNPAATQSFNLSVLPEPTAPVITTQPDTTALTGDLYTYDVNTTGDPAPTFSLITAPSGMTINSASGLIQWTPTAAGDFNVTVKAANGISPDAAQSYILNVQLKPTAPIITTTPGSSGFIGELYSYDVNATGYPTPTYLLTVFPAGMTVHPTTGVIQWTPWQAGNYNVTVKASNGIAPDAAQSFTVNVNLTSCPPSLISYWKLDETSGNVYEDNIGTNNATSTNIPAPIAGRVSGAQQFNGTSNRILAPRIAAYDFAVNSSFTFEAWLKHPTGAYAIEEVVIERKHYPGNLTIKLGFSSNRITFLVRNVTGQLSSVTGTSSLFDNNWHHVVGVMNGSLNQLRIYVDGVLQNSASTAFTAGFTSPSAGISIGWRNVSGDESYFKGLIDEVAIYNSAIDAASITQHYNNGLLNKAYCYDQPTGVAPTITSSPITMGTLGQLYEYNVDATGNAAPTYSLTVFPSGMTIDLYSGLIRWTPSLPGNFGVTVVASNGVSPDASQSFVINVQEPIVAPSNLLAVLNPADTHNVKLTWTDNSANELGFVIERKTGDSLSLEPFIVIDSVLADITTYEDTSVADTTKYTFRVFAFNADATSNYSNLAEVETPVPVELTSFVATVISGQVILEWETATESNNAGFSVQRSKENNKFNDIAFIKGKGTTTNKSIYSFTDKSVFSGKYTYRLKQVDLDGSINYSKVVSVDLGTVDEFVLEQNYPNPFNPSTTIRFALPKNARVNIKLHNTIGQEVANIIDKELSAGVYETTFDASNLSSGVYFYELKAMGTDGSIFKTTKRMILMK